MRRRSRAGGEPVKTRRRKTVTPKRRNAPKAVRGRGPSAASQETDVARLTRERDDALLRETANSEILRLISKSPGDLELVFRTILEHATRICNANFGILYRFDGMAFHFAAEVGTPAEHVEFQKRRGPFQPRAGTLLEHVMRTKQVSRSDDLKVEAIPGPPGTLGGARSMVFVPMLGNQVLIGAIGIYRQEVLPFTDKQTELFRTSPPKPLSPSRTRDCSTNCANHWNSRRLQRTCCALSVHRPASWSRCSRPCWRTQPSCAGRVTARCGLSTEADYTPLQCTAHCRRLIWSNGGPEP